MIGIAAVALAQSLEPAAQQAKVGKQVLFVSGQNGYHTYRIPALVLTGQGTLLAFCEGRLENGSDEGEIHILLKRSTDGGDTWSEQEVIWHDAENTCGNPCPLVDLETGTVWLLMTWNFGKDRLHGLSRGTSKDTRRVFVTHSDDDGVTWEEPKEITNDVKRENWGWYATGPCNGIQMTEGPCKGRLVVPCDHTTMDPCQWFSHVIYSDDHGTSWTLGGHPPEAGGNESTVAQLSDGRLMLNMRGSRGGPAGKRHFRLVSFSDDGGETWSSHREDETLVEPVCQGSLLRYEMDGKVNLLFSNPNNNSSRCNLTVRLTEDDGETWCSSRSLDPGFCAYSCLCCLPDGNIGCLYEAGEESPYETITLARFSWEWLKSEEGLMEKRVFANNGIVVMQGETRTCFASDEHCNFPRYSRMPDGTCLLAHSMGIHTVKERPIAHRSNDNGETWEQLEEPGIATAALQDGVAISLGFRTKRISDNSFAVTCSISTDSWQTIAKHAPTVVFPFDQAWVCCHSRPIQLKDGTVLVGVYGAEREPQGGNSLIIASRDSGHNWEYWGAVARPLYDLGNDVEGANESALVELANGDILCLIRPGKFSSPCLLQSRSTDGGKTWGPLQVLEVNGHVDPQLLLLDNGILVCSFGRPNVNLMFSVKGDGSDWSKPYVFYEGLGDHYTSLWPVSENRFLLAWCRSGFCGRNIEEPNEVRLTEFSIQ